MISLLDLLDHLLHQVEVGIVGDADRDLVDDPVAAEVLHRPQHPERHGVYGPAVVAQPDRAQGEALDGTAIVAADDVLADPERVVEQVEHPRDDVLDQCLRAETDSDADHAGAGDQGCDLHAQLRERHQHAVTATTTNRTMRRIGSSVRRRARGAPHPGEGRGHVRLPPGRIGRAAGRSRCGQASRAGLPPEG